MPNSDQSMINKAKNAAGSAAANIVKDGMIIGLGTGSTAIYFIENLGKRCREGLRITAVATSSRSFMHAKGLGIPIADVNALTTIDMTFDGADEIDPEKNMIKGGGGALLREKIIAKMSCEMVILVDESKLVNQLGAFPLPIELNPFAYNATVYRLNKLGYHGKIRVDSRGSHFVTDGGNYIYDTTIEGIAKPLEAIHSELILDPGVIETGLFLGYAGRVIVGLNSGETKIL